MICHSTHTLPPLSVETVTASQALDGLTSLEKSDLSGDIHVGGRERSPGPPPVPQALPSSDRQHSQLQTHEISDSRRFPR